MTFTIGDRVVFTSDGLRGRIIQCDCARCASGGYVAINQYPLRCFPAVFPNGRHLEPAHRIVSGVARDLAAVTERHASQLSLGFHP